MNRFLKYLLGILCLGLLGSCTNEYENILRSNDIELKYNTAMRYYEEKDYLHAQGVMEQLTGVLKNDKRIDDLYFKFAYTHYYTDNFMLANYYFRNFANTFPNSVNAEEARYMAAMAEYKQSPEKSLEQSHSESAIEAFQLFINTFPNSARVEEATKLMDELRIKIVDKAYESALLYLKINDYKSAIHVFDNFVRDYPDAPQVEEARFLSIKAAYKLAQNSIELVQAERYDDVVAAYKTFKEKYPSSRFLNDATTYYNNSIKIIEKLRNS
jgi:outer membrane protein assembly factor BamD